MLYIVATPIGNLDDISFRAVNVLKTVDLILAEDTRHSKKLLNHYQITTKMKAFHEHNEKQQLNNIIELLKSKNIALISDAGTPLINDPGFNLVQFAVQNNIQVSPIPGCSSVISALSVAGITCDKFCFLGFVPTKQAEKLKFVHQLNTNHYTSICFESPKRILSTIKLIKQIFDNNRRICIAKELTKKFETVINGNSEKIMTYLTSDKNHQNGEFVLLISANRGINKKQQQLSEILPILSKELSSAQTAKIAAKITGLTKQYCYEKLL